MAELKVGLLKSLFAGYFEKHDVLLCPVLPFTAQPHNYVDVVVNGVTVPNYQAMKPTLPFNMTGQAGTENLPVPIQPEFLLFSVPECPSGCSTAFR
jgi:Asp-tRNA(Asn)/Glu-tRNA(Gln) amidotransferase A subunit family amidase